jgi:D-3-phosphoglycerate dehydrogenase / 2-oxoglutarate reductase
VPNVLISNRDASLGLIADELERQGNSIVVLPPVELPPGQPRIPSAEEIERYWLDADAFIMGGRDRVPREVLEAAPNLRVGASWVIGTEHIDVEAATDLGIVIGFGATPENYLGVSEAVVMLTAALLRRLPAKWEALRTGGYRVDDPGQMVQNHVIGLVGLGNVGRGAARRLQGWDARLIAYDPYVAPEAAAELGVELVDFETLLRTADVVSIMVTLTHETRYLIGERELGLMKPGAHLVNTARGACVDEEALLRALDEQHLAGAAIDVWEVEPAREDHPLRTHPKVIATGHNIAHSREAYASLVPAAVENISRGLRGEPPLYVRNPEVLPRWRERLARLGVTPASA